LSKPEKRKVVSKKNANKFKVGLNLVKNRLHSVTNVVDKKMDGFEFGKL